MMPDLKTGQTMIASVMIVAFFYLATFDLNKNPRNLRDCSCVSGNMKISRLDIHFIASPLHVGTS
jgi:hypothetical protein